MRKRVRVIMVVVAVAFVAGFLLGELWAVLSGRRGAADPRMRGVVARVGDRDVTAEEMNRARARVADEYQQENRLRDLTIQDYDVIESRTWQWLVNELTWQRLLDKAGVTTTEAEVIEIMRANPPEEMLRNPALLDSAGEFDHQRYLQAMELDENRPYFFRYFRELAEFLPREKLHLDMTNSFRVTSGDLERHRRIQGERVAVTMLFFGPRVVGTPYEPTDEEVREYFEANRDDFRPRAMRHLAYVSFPLQLTAADSAAAESTAERASAQLRAGETFNNTMLDFTDLIPETASVWVTRNQLEPKVDSVIGTLGPGGHSDPFLTPRGWQIVALDSLSPDSVAFRRILIRLRMSPDTRAAVRDEAAIFLDLLATRPFDSLAAERGLRVNRLRPLVGDEPELTGLDVTSPAAIVRWALGAEPGEVMPDPVRGPTGYYILKLSDYQPAVVPDFEEVETRASWMVRQKRERELLVERAREVLAEIRAGRPLEHFGNEDTGIELNSEEYETVADARRRRGPEYAGAVKALDPGQVSGVVETGWGAFIIRCDRREPIVAVDEESVMQERYQHLSQRVVRELLEPPPVEDYRDPLY